MITYPNTLYLSGTCPNRKNPRMVKPAVLLCDEPTGNLDSVTSMEVISLLKTCAARFHQTVIVVTHQEAIAQMADRILRVEDGKLYNAEV